MSPVLAIAASGLAEIASLLLDDRSPEPDDPPGAGTGPGAVPETDSRPRSQVVAVTAPDGGDLLAPVQEWLDEERQGQLFDLFRIRFSTRFPFVIVPESTNPSDMRQQRPYTHLAILAVASSMEFALQRRLSDLFNRALTAKIAAGKLASLDMLQGLLVHLAWAQFHPRPRSYTQQLFLAMSIVADLRLDRPRKQQYWNVDHEHNEAEGDEWLSDELRAMGGTYYLASCEHAIDKFLLCILKHQQCLEDFQSEIVMKNLYSTAQGRSRDSEDMLLPVDNMRDRMDKLRWEITFPLSDCPVLELQLNTLELLVSQQSVPIIPTSITPRFVESNPQMIESLYECMSASKQVVTTFLVMPSGYEHYLSNLEWIVLSWSISSAAKLDVLAGSPQMLPHTKKLRQRLDFPHTLRQVILRLESVVSPGEDSTGDGDVFFHFLRRARGVEAWYLRHSGLYSLSTPGSSNAATSCVGNLNTAATNATGEYTADGRTDGQTDFSFADLFPEGMEALNFGIFLGEKDFDSF
ncbi:hypothetical protein GE09DRAFT_1213369 [Coniochaeta sp. 2T2.1]|nr:hypothetical protein GE09DRAFT_1213369 [Coniochaeta sp. 2T2.1]